jgi:hypothetical protein
MNVWFTTLDENYILIAMSNLRTSLITQAPLKAQSAPSEDHLYKHQTLNNV